MTPDARFHERNDEIEKLLRDIGHRLKDRMPEGWGFTLFLFDYVKPTGESGAIFYISSARRDDMRKSLEEFLRNEAADFKT